jgi:hypothetical protein
MLLGTANGQDNRPLAIAGLLFDILPCQVLQPNFFFQFYSPYSNDLRLIAVSSLKNINEMSRLMRHEQRSCKIFSRQGIKVLPG